MRTVYSEVKDPPWLLSGPALEPIVAIRSMREDFSIEALWTEWGRKTKVVDHQVQRARSRAA